MRRDGIGRHPLFSLCAMIRRSPTVARALLRAASRFFSTLFPPRNALRRQESRRGTHECAARVRAPEFALIAILLDGGGVLNSRRRHGTLTCSLSTSPRSAVSSATPAPATGSTPRRCCPPPVPTYSPNPSSKTAA